MNLLRGAAVLAILFASTAAFAVPVIPSGFTVSVGAGPPSGVPGQGPPFGVPPLGPPDFVPVPVPGVGPDAFFIEKFGLGVGNCGGPPGPPADCFDVDFNILANPDPSLTIELTATNLTTETLLFGFTVMLPISPILFGLASASGSISGTLTDTNGDGATFNSISSVDVFTNVFNPSGGGSGTLLASGLFLDPFSFSVASGEGDFLPSSFGPAEFTVGTMDEIGIRIEFELSPMDVAGITATFFVIPEPGTGILLLTGLTIAAFGLRRRVL